ncbi:hypothetical protein [Corynebacterium glyciniphilum]|uniref:hypothetical protein n=1 Tax=Corynebacterium glyciniphilum TaxID=1404244 RepID=UPI003DA1512D
MAQNSLSLPIKTGALRLVTTAEATPRSAYEYSNGQRTDTPRVHADGWQVHTIRDLTGSLDGEAVEVTIETSTPDSIPAGAVIEPDGPATLRVRGASQQGSSFASLILTVAAPRWKVVGSIADALGLAKAAPAHEAKASDQDKKAAA